MLEDLKNNIDFFIRSKTKFSRKNFVEKSSAAIERNNKENAYVFDILNQYFEKKTDNNVKVLDVGSKNWFYVKGEHSFFDSFCSEFELDGVEIDAYRLYSNFYSRYETAKFYQKGFKNTNYIADDLLNINKEYDYIIWLLPFVLQDPHVLWGLPRKYFCPEKLLKHVYFLMKENAQLLIINQGEAEANAQKYLLDLLNIKYEEKGIVKSEFLQYKNKRYAFLIKK